MEQIVVASKSCKFKYIETRKYSKIILNCSMLSKDFSPNISLIIYSQKMVNVALRKAVTGSTVIINFDLSCLFLKFRSCEDLPNNDPTQNSYSYRQ